jgi:hypothetical protein
MRSHSLGTLLMAAVAAVVAALLPGPASAATAAGPAPSGGDRGFVTRSGSQLELGGRPYRFSGANIEWLGLIGYGVLNFDPGQNERYPSRYEIDDALATAHEMGATVVRAQTLGDTVGCSDCLEPRLGTFNPRAFQVMDYAVARARAYGIRLILEFQGDARAEHVASSADIFSAWRGGADFWTDPTVIRDFENHIAAVVDHVNPYTGVRYRDDPAILGWMDCNVCQLLAGAAAGAWVKTISGYVKSLDPRHLFFSNATIVPDQQTLALPSVDAYSTELYPHWAALFASFGLTDLPSPQQMAATTAAAGKAWFLSEFGWDHTNYPAAADLHTLLAGFEQDPDISGDLYWALESHADGHGWEPIPANDLCQPGAMDNTPPTGPPSPGGAGCATNEDGNWWALYYTGIPTLSNTQSDMAQRAQMLRTHAYRMRGFATPPPHDVPPRPGSASVEGGRVRWQGSAGAAVYSIEHADTRTGPWTLVCDRCVGDLSGGWAQTVHGGWFRVIPYNLDGVPGPASHPARDTRDSHSA